MGILLRTAWKVVDALERRASRTAGPLATSFGTGPVFSPRRYDTFAKEGFQKNVIVYRAIEMVAGGVASIPWTLTRQDDPDGEAVEITDHPFLELINRPNPWQDRKEFIHDIVGYLSVAGNSYVEGVKPRREKSPRELWVKRPDRMKVVPGPLGVAGYEWSKGGSDIVRWGVNPVTGESDIRHIRTFNPVDDWYGMSPIEAAAFNVDQHNEADAWNMGLLKNFAAPSGALETESHLGVEEVTRLRDEWRQRQQGSENAGNVVFLTHGFRWRGLAFSPREMTIVQSKAFNARFIALALGVPPFLLGLPEGSTFTNYGEARLAFWDETVVPLAYHIVGEFSNWLLPQFENTQNLTIGLNLDEIPALELRRTSKWNRNIKAVEGGVLTPNDARKRLGFSTHPDGDRLHAPRGTTSADADANSREEKLDRLLRILERQVNPDEVSQLLLQDRGGNGGDRDDSSTEH